MGADVEESVVAHTGLEPVISALRGRRPGPLDECATDTSILAPERGCGKARAASAVRLSVSRCLTGPVAGMSAGRIAVGCRRWLLVGSGGSL